MAIHPEKALSATARRFALSCSLPVDIVSSCHVDQYRSSFMYPSPLPYTRQNNPEALT